MKKLFLFCFAACLSVVVSAQKAYFLYLQTDDQSPFYVRMADKIYSSSTAGYLILPNLTDTTYTLGVGFAKSTLPETRFAVTINQNDKGYLIKNFTDGLSLFDLQDLSIVKSVSAAKDNTVYETKTDKFSAILSKAADDPSLLKVPVVKKEEAKPKPEEKEPITAKVEEKKPVVVDPPKDTVAVAPQVTAEVKAETKEEPIKTETTAKTTTEETKKPEVKEPVQATNIEVKEYKPSTIVRRSESSTTEGFGVVFFDRMENSTDTIRILIPPSKVRIDDDAQTVSVSEIEKRNEKPLTEVEQPKSETRNVQPAVDLPEAREKVEEKPATKSQAVGNCKQSASEKDFMKLRKNMASEDTDEAMIDEAKKVFKSKCFTVEQVRYLSTLFLTSAAKYQFFDASYSYVSDKQNFSSLQSEIKDEYYLKRFKALAGE